MSPFITQVSWMKPYVICNMLSPLDGRVDPSRWSQPAEGEPETWTGLYYQIEKEFDAEAYIVGRITMEPFATGNAEPITQPAVTRPIHRVPGVKERLAVVIDPKGRLHWESGELDGDHLLMVVGPDVDDGHLAELAARRVSYVVMDSDPVNPADVLNVLANEFGAKTVLLEGGGVVNGAFMAAGVVDEVSIVLVPAIDGKSGGNTIFEHQGGLAGSVRLRFLSATPRNAGVMHLRYAVENS